MTHSTPTMSSAVDAPRIEIASAAGHLSYYVAGEGAPLLLIHSINAAGSVYEVKPIFEHYRRTRRVYALDLPGFGFSERSARRYDVALYTSALDAMFEVMNVDNDGQSVDALALSLSSEFLARVASNARHEALRSLALITPTGFNRGADQMREAQGSTREMAWLHSVLTVGLWRKGLYGLLTRPGTIRYFLKRTNGSDTFDEGLAAYDDVITDQPGAEHAPYAFLSGGLFSKDIRNVYESLTLPVFLGHGTRGDFKDFSEATWTETRANWTRAAFESGALPHFDVPDPFFSALDAFYASVAANATAPDPE
ncbi:MAG: alpha/beta fold hydrolase [Gammaproteobacteria bacterium]